MKKLCIDCKWCDLGSGIEFAKCKYVKREIISKVDNKRVKIYQLWDYCDVLRGNTIPDYILCYVFGICGAQGRYFKPKKHPQKNSSSQKVRRTIAF